MKQQRKKEKGFAKQALKEEATPPKIGYKAKIQSTEQLPTIEAMLAVPKE